MKDKGVERIYLMGYSMGGRMTSASLANQPVPGIVGYIDGRIADAVVGWLKK
ncbi:MAG: hypothetical protein H7125_15595 [Proteobacteria bacterium]|nr:hypothetical protein [Burkholderiales bacterium]